jgi:hypothetical protein
MMPEQPGMKNAALNAGKALGAVQGVTQRPVSAAVIVSISANAFGASQNAKSEGKVKRAAASVTPGVKSYEAASKITPRVKASAKQNDENPNS